MKTSIGSKKTDEAQTTTLQCKYHGAFEGQAIFFEALNKHMQSQCPECAKEKNLYETTQRNEAEKRKVEMLLNNSHIPDRFKHRTFANYQVSNSLQQRVVNIAQNYAEQFEERLTAGGGLILLGKPGTGKTHLAIAIANQVMQSHHPTLFTTAMRCIRAIKDCYSPQSEKSEQQVIEQFIKPHLLIIDEIGVQFGSETEKLILFEILNGRYEALRPTIIISNCNEDELTKYLGTRVIDRLVEGGGIFLRFDWESYRKKLQLVAN